MARRVDPRHVAELAGIQHARRLAAESALEVARAGEERAAESERAAREATAAAQDAWLDHLGRPGFEPEYARQLAHRLVTREAAASEAAERRRHAVDLHDHRRADWQSAEARCRATDDRLVDARRAAGRRREQRRLETLADRITFKMSRS